MQTTPYDSLGTLVWKIAAKFQHGQPNGGNSQPMSRYISETVQDRDIVTIEDL